MPANIRNVSFVNPLDPAGAAAMQIQQQEIQRRQALAQALQEQSMQQERVAPGSRISWTQGLAKLAQALAAKSVIKDTNKQSVDLATKQGEALQRAFGLNPTQTAPQQSVPQGVVQNTAPQLAPQAQAGAQVNPMPADSMSVPPQAPAPAPQPTSGPMNLSGNPVQDYTDYSMNPEEYTKALITAHSPTEVARNLMQQGIRPGTPEYIQAMSDYNSKQSYIPPVNGRPGATIRDPRDPSKVVGYDAPLIEGAVAEYGRDGMPSGYKQLPGANEAMQAVNAAKAVGSAAGDLVDVYNPSTHQMVKVPKSALLSGAAGGQAPMASGPPLGADAAFTVTGKNSANAFQAISDGAADVPNRIYALTQMSNIVADPKTVLGPGSEQWNKVRGVLGTLTGTAAPSTTNAQEFSKWASQYSARSAQELGLSGSDARVQIAVHATPNGEMTKDALRGVIPQMVGLEHAKQGYATAADQWQRTHGPDSVQTFRTEWNKVYNPSIYTHMVQGPQAFAGWVKSLSPKQAAQTRNQYLQLKQLGALPQ